MNRSRRAFVFATAATTLAAATPLLAAPEEDQEKLAIAYFNARGLHKFLLLNKRRGQILAVENGEVILRKNAISGKVAGDEIDTLAPVTPAGFFSLAFSRDQDGPNASMSFNVRRDGSVDVVHPVINVPGQSRMRRLTRGTAADKKISSGCVNLAPDDYRLMAQFARSARQTMTSVDGSRQISGSFFVVLPDRATATRQILHIPDDFRP